MYWMTLITWEIGGVRSGGELQNWQVLFKSSRANIRGAATPSRMLCFDSASNPAFSMYQEFCLSAGAGSD